jgi:hypothetical protein
MSKNTMSQEGSNGARRLAVLQRWLAPAPVVLEQAPVAGGIGPSPVKQDSAAGEPR